MENRQITLVGNNDAVLKALPSYHEIGYKQAGLTFEGENTVLTLTKTIE